MQKLFLSAYVNSDFGIDHLTRKHLYATYVDFCQKECVFISPLKEEIAVEDAAFACLRPPSAGGAEWPKLIYTYCVFVKGVVTMRIWIKVL